MSDEIVLHYIGEGAFIPNVPARDLTQADVDACGLTAAEILSYQPPVYEPVQEADISS